MKMPPNYDNYRRDIQKSHQLTPPLLLTNSDDDNDNDIDEIDNNDNINGILDGILTSDIIQSSDLMIPNINWNQLIIPLEFNLKELLIRVSGTEQLAQVTKVKIRVIAREVPLQHLNLHVPCLRELVLDGSVLSTLRELGNGLRNVRVLSVNHCQIDHLDGVFGFENLEELYAADNLIEDLTPCVFLSNLRIADFSRNQLKQLLHTLSFLCLCEKLESLNLDGNDGIKEVPMLQHKIKELIPSLKFFEGKSIGNDYNNNSTGEKKGGGNYSENNQRGFFVSFPPRAILDTLKKNN